MIEKKEFKNTCGHMVDETMDFCPACGAKVETEKNKMVRLEKENKKYKAILEKVNNEFLNFDNDFTTLHDMVEDAIDIFKKDGVSPGDIPYMVEGWFGLITKCQKSKDKISEFIEEDNECNN